MRAARRNGRNNVRLQVKVSRGTTRKEKRRGSDGNVASCHGRD